MAKPIILLVPGFMGSKLKFVNRPAVTSQTLWLDKANLSVFGFRAFELDATGLNPAKPWGADLFAEGLLDIYLPLAKRLQQLYSRDYDVSYVSYDWRLSLELEGRALANAIARRATRDNPARLVCHSMGGLLARYAYRILVQRGQQDLIARIVTLATPHYGCWNTAEVWGLWDETQADLAFISNIMSKKVLLWLIAAPVINHANKVQVANIASTFPSVYQCLTFIGPLQDRFDPLARAGYVVGNYNSEVKIDGALLAAARVSFQGAMLDPLTAVPQAKMKAVAAIKPQEGATVNTTIQRLDRRDFLNTTEAYLFGEDGDGVVPLWSAVSVYEDFYVAKATHDLIVQSPVVFEKIDEWLFPRTPAPPIPDLVEQIKQAETQPGAPETSPNLVEIAQRVSQGVSVACATGACRC